MRSRVTYGILALGLGGVIALNTLAPAHNVVPNAPVGTITSSAIYCTGLSGASGATYGRIEFVNASSAVRTARVVTYATHARKTSVTTWLTLPAHSATPFTPTKHLSGTFYAVAAYVNGGGVAGEELLASNHSQVSCVSGATATWFGAGLSTRVGSISTLTLFNPTATIAVANVTAMTPNGLEAPQPLRGITVDAFGFVNLNLADYVVNTGRFGVNVTALRGALVVSDEQNNAGVPSILSGGPATQTSTFALVPTSEGDRAQLTFASPSAASITVTVSVRFPNTTVPAQQLTVAPYSVASFSVTPNTAIPADGGATVHVTASAPVGMSELWGRRGGLHVASAESPAARWLLADASGAGLGNAAVTNTGSNAESVVVGVGTSGTTPQISTLTVPANQSVSLRSLLGAHATLRNEIVSVDGSAANLLVSASAQSSPTGIIPVAGLHRG